MNVGGSGTFTLEFEATDRTGNTTVVDGADAAVPPAGSHPYADTGQRHADPHAHTAPHAGTHGNADAGTDANPHAGADANADSAAHLNPHAGTQPRPHRLV